MATTPEDADDRPGSVGDAGPGADGVGPSGDGVEAPLVGPGEDREVVLSVVMPTLNEAAGIEECIRGVRRAAAELGVPTEVVVADSSTDRTPEIAREMGAVVVEPDATGYGYAYRYAFDRVRGDVVAMGDADTTYDFSELPRLYEPVADGEADLVVGSRLDGEIRPGAMPALHRYVGNPLLTRFLNAFYGVGVTDAHSGYRVLSRSALDRLDLRSDGMEFASEMVMRAGEAGLRVAEVPITYHPRTGEATLDTFRDGWRHVKFMLVNAPGYLYTGPGIALAALGVVWMAATLLDVRVFGTTPGAHSAVAASLCVVMGYQVGSLAVFASLVDGPIRAPADPVTGWIGENFRLEHGATAGVLLTFVGAAYVAWMVSRWALSGFTELPFLTLDMVAFAAIVVGVQTVFHSFFLSMLGQRRRVD